MAVRMYLCLCLGVCECMLAVCLYASMRVCMCLYVARFVFVHAFFGGGGEGLRVRVCVSKRACARTRVRACVLACERVRERGLTCPV